MINYATLARGDLSLDFETFSGANLKTQGLDRYVSHPDAQVLMLGWALDDEHVEIWEPDLEPMPAKLRALLLNPNIVKHAWNAQFERVFFRDALLLDTPIEQWRCTAVLATLVSLDPSLETTGKLMKLRDEHQKDARGKQLIRFFTSYQKPTKRNPATRNTRYTHPKEWEEFREYCRQDVVSERYIRKLLSKYSVPAIEWSIYALDQKINDRGVPVDMVFVHNAISIVKRRRAELFNEMARLTQLANPNSVSQLLPWLRARGYPFQNLQKERIQLALEDFELAMTEDCIAVLKARQSSSKTSVTKYNAIVDRVGAGDRVRYSFQMGGAGRTMRWAGRGVQWHNLKRIDRVRKKVLPEIIELIRDNNYVALKERHGCPIETLSAVIRSCIRAPEGRHFVVSDLKSIETCVSAWMSDVSALLKLIRDGKDAYRDFASVIFGVPYDAVTSEQRGVAKPPVLGGFYMLGGGTRVGKYPDVILTGLMGYAASMGVKIKEADSKQFIAKFRSKYFEVPEMWKKLEDAMIECVQSRQLTRVGHFEFSYQAPFLRLKLPSGRYICYLNPQVKMHTIKHVKGSFTKLAVSYIGKNKAGQYCRVATHPGKIYENLCQAIARDILAYGMLAADKFGFEIVFHVHDEIVALTRDTDQVYNLQKLIELMCIKDKWSRDIPLGAEGYESSFYKKE